MLTENKTSILATCTFIEGPESRIIDNIEFPPKSGKEWVALDFVVDPNRWGKVKPNVLLHVFFVNQFNIDIKGADNWTVGYLNEQGANGVPITTNLDDIVFNNASKGQKNIQGNFRAVIGQNNTIGWTNGSDEGYYRGSFSTPNFDIYRIVAVTQ